MEEEEDNFHQVEEVLMVEEEGHRWVEEVEV